VNEVVRVGEGLWPVFWAAAALMITGMAAWGSTMMMRLIDDRIELAKRQVLDELDAVEERLTGLEAQLPDAADRARLAEPSGEATAQG
jgi:hypothetical protein